MGMKKLSRYPLLAAAVAAAFAAGSAAAAKPITQVPPPVVPRPGLVVPHMTEAAKIQALIASVENLHGAVFIRNGSEYDGKAAADHLRQKLDYAGNRIKTAQQFIDKLASASSMTGKPYKIRYANGSTVDSAVYFHEQLMKLEAPSPAPRTASTKG
jgi:hypothetical protein